MDLLRQVVPKFMLLLSSVVVFGCSTFELTSQPPADVYENGEKIGTTPYTFYLLSGERSFTLKRYGYVERDVLVSAVDPRRQHYGLQWIGRTPVDSIPQGAKVVQRHDGEVLGITPCRLYLSQPVDVVLKLAGFEEIECEIMPNRKHVVELHALDGYLSAYYREIYFTSKQGPVEIYDRVAGERIGVTPARVTVAAGSKLEYRLKGHVAEYALISRKAPYRIDIRLKPLVRVTLCGASGALVYRDGENRSIGELPLEVEVTGLQRYVLRKEGCYDHTVAVSPDSPARINVEMDRILYTTIITAPPGAGVYRIGGLEQLGVTPFKTAVHSESVFEIRKEGYETCFLGVGPSSAGKLRVQLAPLAPDQPVDAAEIGGFDRSVLETF